MMNRLLCLAISITVGCMSSDFVAAQDACVQYQVIPRTIYEAQKVTTYREVMETQYETELQWKPVWTTERRERRYKVLKPVTETSTREERYTVLKPVTETGYREQTFEETTWQTTTEMRDEQVVEEKPVIETSYREEQIRVRKPVTETMMKSENVTVYRPVTSNETRYVPGSTTVNGWGVATAPSATRLRWLPPTSYVDPLTGLPAFRRRGLHWVQSPSTAYYVPQTTVVAALTRQTVERTSLVPETYVQKQPVEVTRYVDEIQTRKVPVETHRTERQVTTRKVPVQVQTPVKRYITKRIPIERVRYERREVIRKVPVTRQRFEEEIRVEPYDVQVCRWEQKEVRAPKVVTRRIPVETTQMMPRTVLMRVAVDIYGNQVQVPMYSQPTYSPYSSSYSVPLETPLRAATEAEAARPARTMTERPSEARRSDSAEPRVEMRAVPGSERVVFEESQLKSETDMVDITPKSPADKETTETSEQEVQGELTPATNEDDAAAGEGEAANQVPSLADDEGDSGKKAFDENARKTLLEDMPGLDPPKPPTGSDDSVKPKDPVDNRP